MKKTFISIISFVIILSTLTISISAENECHWYLKRNKNSSPSFPKEADIIKEYEAYFIDKRDGENVIYLTFDAGYENGNIAKTLDILKEYSVPAAFFLLDNIILKNTDLVLRMVNEGHLVCNHTKNHKNLSFASKDEIAKDLSELEDIYRDKTGLEMAKYFRFPEGKYSINALKCVNNLGYKTIFWSFAYDDWDNRRQMDTEKAKQKILDNTHCGEVVLLHPTSSTNVAILGEVIEAWQKMGYRFGTLDELCTK